MYLNKVLLIGNLTRDPELKSLPSGVQVTNFSLATNRVWKDKDGQKQEDVEFHNVVVFGRQAETSAQYLRKGASVLVEGRLQTRSWESEGQKKYRTEIIADRVQFGSTRGGDSVPQGGVGGESTSSAPNDAVANKGEINYPAEEINPDDIPF